MKWVKLVVLVFVGYFFYRLATHFNERDTGAMVLQSFQRIADASAKPATTEPNCPAGKIAVDKLKGRTDGEYIRITGILRNGCDIATGVQVKVTVYDGTGHVLASEDPWPASINNIPAFADFPFEHMIRHQRGFKTYDVRVIATKQWRSR